MMAHSSRRRRRRLCLCSFICVEEVEEEGSQQTGWRERSVASEWGTDLGGAQEFLPPLALAFRSLRRRADGARRHSPTHSLSLMRHYYNA